MIQLLRILGILLVLAGALVLITWVIEPIRKLWPLLLTLPTPVLIGIVVAFVGIVLVLASLIWERWQERDADKQLRDGGME
ncbi:MAG: hypothetical protein QNJ40_07260 [Xanthomonadales bacterium]|nr:hypothetical protein [Xanthomonadales bacterium]